MAQLRLVFEPLFSTQSNLTRKSKYLAYVEPLKPVRRTTRHTLSEVGIVVDKNSRMASVERVLDADGQRSGMIIHLTDIWRLIDLVPDFGEACPIDWNTDNACDLAKKFFVNTFYEKQTYVALR